MIKTTIILKENTNLEWLIAGDGRWKKLIDKIEENNLISNFKIFNPVPYQKLNLILTMLMLFI